MPVWTNSRRTGGRAGRGGEEGKRKGKGDHAEFIVGFTRRQKRLFWTGFRSRHSPQMHVNLAS